MKNKKEGGAERGFPSAILARTFILDDRVKRLSNNALAVYQRLVARQVTGLKNPASHKALGLELLLPRKSTWDRVIKELSGMTPPLVRIEGDHFVVFPLVSAVDERVRLAQRERARARWSQPRVASVDAGKSAVAGAAKAAPKPSGAAAVQLGLDGFIDDAAAQAVAAAGKAIGCPVEAIVAAYHEICPMLPRVRKVADATFVKHLRARWDESASHRTLEFWRQYFKMVAERPFLHGNNDRGFKADLSWLVGKSAFERVMNGRYAGGSTHKPLFGEGKGKTDSPGHQAGEGTIFN